MGPTTCVGGGTCLFIARTHAVLRGVQTLEIDHGHPGVSASQPAVLGPSQAGQRGWEHSRHRHHLVTVSRLRAETGDGDIRRLFNTASALHENFYENTMSAEDIAEGLDDVQALLDMLDTLLKQV